MNKDKNFGSGKKLFSSKQFKYGSSAVVFTVVFCVFVLLINVVLTLIDSKTGGLYVDMTSKKIYGVTEASEKALEGVSLPIEIVFCRPADIIESSELNSVKLLAESYVSKFSNISVVYKDIFSEPTYFNSFKNTSSDTIYDASIIVHCPTTGLSVVYDVYDMYKYRSSDGAVFAFDGENKLTSAFLKVARDEDTMLKAGFVTGHNENSADTLRHFLTEYGYEVSNVDLKLIDKSTLSKYNLLVVCDPQTDFIGRSAGERGEIELLRDYVTEDFGNIMFFMNANGASLPELSALLSESFGVSLNNRAMITEDSSKASNYIGLGNGLEFYGTYSSEQGTAGYKLHKSISEGGGLSTYFAMAPGLEIVTEQSGNLSVSPVVVTSKNAKISEGEGMVKPWPEKPLITLSEYTKLIGGTDKTANVFVCGTTGFLIGIDEPSFANTDLLKTTLVSMGNRGIVTDIEFKVLDESDLSLTTAQQEGFMKKLGITVPVIIAIIGIAVFVKRKYL